MFSVEDPLTELNFTPYIWYEKIGGVTVKSLTLDPHDPIPGLDTCKTFGFGGSEGAYLSSLKEMAQNGQRTFTGIASRQQAFNAYMSPNHIRDVLRIHSQAGAMTIKAVMRMFELESVQLSDHSMGLPVGVRIAEHMPSESISGITSDAGAGIDGARPIPRIARRLPRIIRGVTRQIPEVRAASPKSIAADSVLHIVPAPIRFIREGLEAPRDIRDRLAHAIDKHGLSFGAILPELDEFFDPEEVLDASIHLMDWHILVPHATHLHTQTKPVEHAALELQAAYNHLDTKQPSLASVAIA